MLIPVSIQIVASRFVAWWSRRMKKSSMDAADHFLRRAITVFSDKLGMENQPGVCVLMRALKFICCSLMNISMFSSVDAVMLLHLEVKCVSLQQSSIGLIVSAWWKSAGRFWDGPVILYAV